MRRKDREMDRDFALQVIDKAAYGVISVIDTEGNPYGFPISFARKGDEIFIHSAKRGKKVEIFEMHQSINMTFVGEVEVPNLLDDATLDSFMDGSKSIFGAKVFTTEYESAIIRGTIRLLDGNDQIEGLRLLCLKYTPDKMKYFDCAIESSGRVTNVYAIKIEEITGKRKKFDSHGEEMKNGRME